jgi:hypothetical protein
MWEAERIANKLDDIPIGSNAANHLKNVEGFSKQELVAVIMLMLFRKFR